MTEVEKLIEKYNNLWEYYGMGSAISFSKVVADLEKIKEKEKEQMPKVNQDKLWTNEEVFDMLYKTDKFLMVDLREYWKTIKK